MKTLNLELQIEVEEKNEKFFLHTYLEAPFEVSKDLYEFLLKVGEDVTPKLPTLEQLRGTWEVIDGVPVVTYILRGEEVSKAVKECNPYYASFSHEGKAWKFIN
jgi:hypothetical protein